MGAIIVTTLGQAAIDAAILANEQIIPTYCKFSSESSVDVNTTDLNGWVTKDIDGYSLEVIGLNNIFTFWTSTKGDDITRTIGIFLEDDTLLLMGIPSAIMHSGIVHSMKLELMITNNPNLIDTTHFNQNLGLLTITASDTNNKLSNLAEYYNSFYIDDLINTSPTFDANNLLNLEGNYDLQVDNSNRIELFTLSDLVMDSNLQVRAVTIVGSMLQEYLTYSDLTINNSDLFNGLTYSEAMVALHSSVIKAKVEYGIVTYYGDGITLSKVNEARVFNWLTHIGIDNTWVNYAKNFSTLTKLKNESWATQNHISNVECIGNMSALVGTIGSLTILFRHVLAISMFTVTINDLEIQPTSTIEGESTFIYELLVTSTGAISLNVKIKDFDDFTIFSKLHTIVAVSEGSHVINSAVITNGITPLQSLSYNSIYYLILDGTINQNVSVSSNNQSVQLLKETNNRYLIDTSTEIPSGNDVMFTVFVENNVLGSINLPMSDKSDTIISHTYSDDILDTYNMSNILHTLTIKNQNFVLTMFDTDTNTIIDSNIFSSPNSPQWGFFHQNNEELYVIWGTSATLNIGRVKSTLSIINVSTYDVGIENVKLSSDRSSFIGDQLNSSIIGIVKGDLTIELYMSNTPINNCQIERTYDDNILISNSSGLLAKISLLGNVLISKAVASITILETIKVGENVIVITKANERSIGVIAFDSNLNAIVSTMSKYVIDGDYQVSTISFGFYDTVGEYLHIGINVHTETTFDYGIFLKINISDFTLNLSRMIYFTSDDFMFTSQNNSLIETQLNTLGKSSTAIVNSSVSTIALNSSVYNVQLGYHINSADIAFDADPILLLSNVGIEFSPMLMTPQYEVERIGVFSQIQSTIGAL